MSGYDDGWRSHDERVAKVQEAFEKARKGKGLFGIDVVGYAAGLWASRSEGIRNRQYERVVNT